MMIHSINPEPSEKALAARGEFAYLAEEDWLKFINLSSNEYKRSKPRIQRQISQKRFIWALSGCDSNFELAARKLGISQKTLVREMGVYNIHQGADGNYHG